MLESWKGNVVRKDDYIITQEGVYLLVRLFRYQRICRLLESWKRKAVRKDDQIVSREDVPFERIQPFTREVQVGARVKLWGWGDITQSEEKVTRLIFETIS